MSRIPISYKELQRKAKECGIPANMKRSFLESALQAFECNDAEKVDSIVKHHRSNRKRRSQTQQEPVRPKINRKFLLAPELKLELNNIDLMESDNENSVHFHPDSTSTPIHSSVNRFHVDSEYRISNIVGRDNVCIPLEPRTNIAGYFSSVPAILPGNLDQNDVRSAYYNGLAYKAPFHQLSQSPFCVFDNSAHNYAVENHYSVQPSYNSRYCEVNSSPSISDTNRQRPLMIHSTPKNPNVLPDSIEKEYTSNHFPVVPQLSDLEECPSTPGCSWSQNIAVADDLRTVQISPLVAERSNLTDVIDNRPTDVGSIRAEFDSNSDNESLALDEFAPLFESHFKEDEIRPVSNSLNLYQRPNVNVESLDFFNVENELNSVNWHGDRKINVEESETDQDQGQDSGFLGFTSSQTQQSAELLPSVATLLPEYSIQSYCHQAYMKIRKPFCTGVALDDSSAQSVSKTLNEMPNVDGDSSKNTDSTLKNYSTPYLSTSTSQLSTSILRSSLALPSNEITASANTAIASTMFEDFASTNVLNLVDKMVKDMQLYEEKNDLSKSTSDSSCETVINQNSTRVVVERIESISIEGAATNMKKIMSVERKNIFENNVDEICKNSKQYFQLESNDFRSCKNRLYGCIAVFENNETLARIHEKECIYQVVHCPSDKCDWCDIIKLLTAHIYECHKSDLNIGNDLVYAVSRSENDEVPFITHFQLHEGTIFVITMHINEKKCITTVQYLPEVETTDFRNKCIRGVMQLIHFTSKVESKTWKGIVLPYFENDEALFEKGNTLQSIIGNSKNIILRVLIN